MAAGSGLPQAKGATRHFRLHSSADVTASEAPGARPCLAEQLSRATRNRAVEASLIALPDACCMSSSTLHEVMAVYVMSKAVAFLLPFTVQKLRISCHLRQCKIARGDSCATSC